MAQDLKSKSLPVEKQPDQTAIGRKGRTFDPPPRPLHPKKFEKFGKIPHTGGGGERSPAKGLGRPEEDLQPKDILKRDFDYAVENDDLPGFFAKHPELARMGWKQEEASRKQKHRTERTPGKAAEERARAVEHMTAYRNRMSPEKADAERTKAAERMRIKRAERKRQSTTQP